jgi:hypothetical protein
MNTTTDRKVCKVCNQKGRYTGAIKNGEAHRICPNSHDWWAPREQR